MRKSPFPWVSSPGGSGSGSDLPFARKHSSSPSMAFPRRPTRSLALFTYILAAVCIYVIFFRPQVPVLEPEEYGERIADDGQDISDSHGSSSSSRSSQSNAGASASTAVTAELLRQSVTTSGADSDMEKPYGPAYHGHSTPADVNRVTNATLGFQKVLVLHLPSRSDKRDALALASALTGFGPVEYVEGVRGDTVPDKALPPGGAGVRKTGGNGYVGSWRGHMNAIRK